MEMDFAVNEERKSREKQERGNSLFDPALSHKNLPLPPVTSSNPYDPGPSVKVIRPQKVGNARWGRAGPFVLTSKHDQKRIPEKDWDWGDVPTSLNPIPATGWVVGCVGCWESMQLRSLVLFRCPSGTTIVPWVAHSRQWNWRAIIGGPSGTGAVWPRINQRYLCFVAHAIGLNQNQFTVRTAAGPEGTV